MKWYRRLEIHKYKSSPLVQEDVDNMAVFMRCKYDALAEIPAAAERMQKRITSRLARETRKNVYFDLIKKHQMLNFPDELLVNVVGFI